ncbi:MAG: FecR family protein [Micropepsaceae bacterium]
MKLTRRQALMLATAYSALGATRAFAADGVGALESVANEVWGTQTGASRVALTEAAAIFRNQRLETGEESAAGVRFIDASKLTLGANASAVIDEYVFAGDASRSTVTLAKGAFRFISGQMPEKNMRLKTPSVSIGIRGTELKIDVYEDGSTELSTIEGAANIVSNATNEALDILAGHSVLADANGVFGVIRDFIHKSKDEAIERGLDELRSRVPVPIPDFLNPFR